MTPRRSRPIHFQVPFSRHDERVPGVLHGKHRARRHAHNLLRCAPDEHVCKARTAVRAYHDQVRVAFLGRTYNLYERFADGPKWRDLNRLMRLMLLGGSSSLSCPRPYSLSRHFRATALCTSRCGFSLPVLLIAPHSLRSDLSFRRQPVVDRILPKAVFLGTAVGRLLNLEIPFFRRELFLPWTSVCDC